MVPMRPDRAHDLYTDEPHPRRISSDDGDVTPLSTHRRIARRMRSILSGFKPYVRLHDIDQLKSLYSSHLRDDTIIDYDQLGYAFAYSYFLENFWKAATAFELPRAIPQSIVDLGCGSGSLSLAYLALIDGILPVEQWPVDVYLVDRSSVQLEIARHIIDSIKHEFRKIRLSIHLIHDDIESWFPGEDLFDVTLFGHVLGENPVAALQFLDKSFSLAKSEGYIYILERTDDPIWEKLRSCVTNQLALPFEFSTTALQGENSRPEEFAPKTRIMTARSAIQVPPKLPVRLVQRYFQAWRERSPELLAEVFAPNARYFEKPGLPPLEGIGKIQQYWAVNVQPQKRQIIDVLNVAYGESLAFVEWHSEFDNIEYHVCLDGMLALTIDPAVERAIELREHFRSVKTPLL